MFRRSCTKFIVSWTRASAHGKAYLHRYMLKHPPTSHTHKTPPREFPAWNTSFERPMRICAISLTYLLHAAVLLDKLTGSQLVKKFPAFYGTRRFNTAFTNLRHLSLSWASSIRYIPPHPTSWRSILILSSHLRLGLRSGSFPQVSHQNPVNTSSPYVLHVPPISFFSIWSPKNIGWAVHISNGEIEQGIERLGGVL